MIIARKARQGVPLDPVISQEVVEIISEIVLLKISAGSTAELIEYLQFKFLPINNVTMDQVH